MAKNENVGMITSSPGPIPSAIKAATSASVPEDTPTAKRDAHERRQLALQRLDFRTHNELLRVADSIDGRADVAANRRVLELEIE